jgi:transposase InsO family protein
LAFTDALTQSGIAGSIGSVGEALDNRLHSSLGYLSPTDYENRYRDHVTSTPEVA